MSVEISSIKNGELRSSAQKANINHNRYLDVCELSAFEDYAKKAGCPDTEITAIINKVRRDEELIMQQAEETSFWSKAANKLKDFVKNPVVQGITALSVLGLGGYGLYKLATKKGSFLNKQSGLAACLGLVALLASCAKSIGPEIEEMEPEPDETVPNVQQQTITRQDDKQNTQGAAETTEDILNSLGLLQGAGTSINNIKTISFRDSEGVRHCMRPKNATYYSVRGEGMAIGSTDSARDIYTYSAKSSENGELIVEKTYSTKDEVEYKSSSAMPVEKLSYVLNKDGSVTEYVYENDTKVKKSTYIKQQQEDGTNKIVRKFEDGTEIVYDKIKNNEPYPMAITFGASVYEVEEEDTNSDI